MSTLFLEFNDTYFRDVAAKIIQNNCAITYLVTSFPELYRDNQFSKTTILDERQFHFSDLITALNNKNSASLTKNLIASNHELESLYLSISDRLCFYPKTVLQRKQRYYELLLFWDTFLEEKKITTILFPRVPHLGYGNIIYYLAKRKKIKTIIVRETLLANKVLLTTGYNDYKKVPISFLSSLSLKNLQHKVGQDWLDTIYQKSQLMKTNLQDNSTTMKQNTASFLSELFNTTTLKAVISLLHNPFERVYGSPFYMEPPTTWGSYYLMIAKYYFKNRDIFSFYNSLTQDIAFDKKYLYFPLHFQPERTSMPEGDIFENQLLIIDIISKTLPPQWSLYVKEHPNQFSRMDIRKMNFRDKNFYLKIKKYSNVKLVPLATSSKNLIDHCQASVTLTGSTGWETLLAHKPVITFSSSAWYYPCNSCHLVTSQEESQKALEQIKKSTPSKVLKDVYKYLLYYKNKFITAEASVEFTNSENYQYQMLITNLAHAIIKRV